MDYFKCLLWFTLIIICIATVNTYLFVTYKSYRWWIYGNRWLWPTWLTRLMCCDYEHLLLSVAGILVSLTFATLYLLQLDRDVRNTFCKYVLIAYLGMVLLRTALYPVQRGLPIGLSGTTYFFIGILYAVVFVALAEHPCKPLWFVMISLHALLVVFHPYNVFGHPKDVSINVLAHVVGFLSSYWLGPYYWCKRRLLQ